MSPETKTCQNCKSDFIIDSDDFIYYEKIKVPPPTFCWRCRAIRRMAFRNMRHLYPRICNATGKKIYSLVPPDSKIPVYDFSYWSSDKWNPFDYGKDYDFSRPFFEQLKDLHESVPWSIMWSMEMVNCNYCVSGYSKNCYLCFDSGYDEDSAYNVTLLYSKQCFDGINIKDCELCYYSINLAQCYKTFFSRNCTSCVEVWFSQDCVGCTNCLGCSGLRNKNYCIFNEQYDKQTYEEKIREMKLNTYSGILQARKLAENFWQKSPVKYQHSVLVTNSTGDYLQNGTNLQNCFFVGNAKDLKHCQSVIYPPNGDGMDITSSEGTELCYEVIACGNGVTRALGCIECVNLSYAYYSINCRQANNIFGCVGLKSADYCILNKKYSKEEYLKLTSKIKKHMEEMPYIDAQGRKYTYGDFFPFDMAPHGYSQSQAFEYFPITESEAQAMGYKWRIPDERKYQINIKAEELLDNIDEISNGITQSIIQCEHQNNMNHKNGCDVDCASAFKITEQELSFYKQMNLPIPRLCFNCRHVDRVSWRNVPALYNRQCMCEEGSHGHSGKCTNQFETSYAPNRPEKVYCEDCYQKETV